MYSKDNVINVTCLITIRELLWGPAKIKSEPQISLNKLWYTATPLGRVLIQTGSRLVFLIPRSKCTSEPPTYLGSGGVDWFGLDREVNSAQI